MRMVRFSTLTSWTRFKECRELIESEYVEWSDAPKSNSPHKFVFVSHRWTTPTHPDPDGRQLLELQQRLNELHKKERDIENAVIFYDYCSLMQRPRTNQEDATFYRDLASLEMLSKQADKFIILSEGYCDYKNRAWCFFEAVTVRSNVHFFVDQSHIRDDLYFRDSLMCEDIPQITSYDFSYKPDLNEAEIIVAAFQHLRACKVSHADDLPLIKRQLESHYNNRRLTAFGRLITALNAFFDAEFAVISSGGENNPYPCKPFFEEPEWVRLQSLASRAAIMGGRGGDSLFALPQEKWKEMRTQSSQGFIPILRLSVPGVSDVREFLDGFKNCGDWRRYIVTPLSALTQNNCFPTVDHIIHTILERPPGFFCSKDFKQLYFFLSDL